jgi:hypothetical protein
MRQPANVINIIMDMPLFSSKNKTISVAYLVRGADKDWFLSCERFLDSYRSKPAGIDHSLYVIFKGFENDVDLKKARTLFKCIPYEPVFLTDDSFDIGAYIEWANMIEEDLICVFNTASKILTPDWLRKLAINLAMPNVELVGATASYESLNTYNSAFPVFPNIHIRSTAFMIDRVLFCNITKDFRIATKLDAMLCESGPKSITRQVLARGKNILLVGRNGRGYSPSFWPASDTFRRGMQKNLLVSDNQTRNFLEMPWNEKREFVIRTWGNI